MASLPQQALDIVTSIEAVIENGPLNDKAVILDLCAAIQLLAQNALAATPSSIAIGDGLANVDVATTVPVNTPT